MDVSLTKNSLLRFCWQLLLSQWFFIALAVFIVLAHFFPNFARHGGLIRGEYSIGYGAVAAIFLQSGLSMSTKKLCLNMGNWRAHITILTISFLITSSIVFGICCGIEKADDPNIDSWVLVGLIMTASCPTTVASNVIMTKKAGGNDLLCLCEVFIGNILGAFVTPAIAQMYLKTGIFAFGNPANGTSVSNLYRDVMKQIGLSVFVPLFVGQVLQNVFPRQVAWTLKTFRLGKIGSICLLLIMFSSFSTAFYQKAFQSVSHACIIFVVFFNIGIYLFFTLICYFCARPPFLLFFFRKDPDESCSRVYKILHQLLRPFYHSKKDCICVMFCGAAKTAALGVSLISSQYGSDSPHLGKLLVPLVLYQSEQVITANFLVSIFNKWSEDEQEDQSAAAQDLEKASSGCVETFSITERQEDTIFIQQERQPPL
ncbi:LAFE_0F06964g1_1 [Lachancea fermentati]|uniref:LAFE_0F06964g1_1 n=1 Tax=Lachancea fermentati TaxID=4955 RepID=A0A1G4MEW2_LACFM|nr:LAFE_0F06964g1_1 [Lachancea fermentati]